MAKKKNKTAKVPKPAKKGSSKKSRGEQAKGFIKGKVKWGEAALFALLGYEMGNVFQGTGVPEYLYQQYPAMRNAVALSTAKDSGDFINKLVGLGTGSKVLYDGMVKNKVDQTDLSILLPYTIGTIFDANKISAGSSGSPNERW